LFLLLYLPHSLSRNLELLVVLLLKDDLKPSAFHPFFDLGIVSLKLKRPDCFPSPLDLFVLPQLQNHLPGLDGVVELISLS
jgi:hypothetical protein